jgi:hypothetical protein
MGQRAYPVPHIDYQRDLDAIFPPGGRRSRGQPLSLPSCPRAFWLKPVSPFGLFCMTMVAMIHLCSSYRVSRLPPPEAGRLERPLRFVLVAYFTKVYVVPKAPHKGITPDARSGRIPWRNTDCCRLSLLDHAAEIKCATSGRTKGLQPTSFLGG